MEAHAEDTAVLPSPKLVSVPIWDKELRELRVGTTEALAAVRQDGCVDDLRRRARGFGSGARRRCGRMRNTRDRSDDACERGERGEPSKSECRALRALVCPRAPGRTNSASLTGNRRRMRRVRRRQVKSAPPQRVNQRAEKGSRCIKTH